jgi:hypothetical protein
MQGRVQAGDGLQVGDGPRAVQIRFHEDLFAAIEGWRRQQPVIPSRPAAIRELIRQSLDSDLAASREQVKS